MAYSDKVLDHYSNPRNVGSMDKNSSEVGTGLVGAPECGDVMKLQIKVNPQTNIIEDAKFKTFGCGSAIASSSLATEWVKGKTVDEALQIKNTEIVKELALPPVKIHCSVLAEDANPGGHSRLEEEAGSGAASGCRREVISPRLGRSIAHGITITTTMTTATEQTTNTKTPATKGVQLTDKAVARVRIAMAKEGVSPEQGGVAAGRAGWRLLRAELQHPF